MGSSSHLAPTRRHLLWALLVLVGLALAAGAAAGSDPSTSTKQQQQQQQQQRALLATIIDESMDDDIGDDSSGAQMEESIIGKAALSVGAGDDTDYDTDHRPGSVLSQLHRRAAGDDSMSLLGEEFETTSSRQLKQTEGEKLGAIDPGTRSGGGGGGDEYEISVSDQFVALDNDALFRCQLPGQWRDLYQLVAWLEDGQPLPELSQQLSQQQQQSHQPLGRSLVLPDGQLYVKRVQLRDANKSYRCQVRNLLTGQLSMSPLSGRLFVTDANEQGAQIQPRIVDSPPAITLAKLNEQILLSCLAQGSPRPTMRWFKQPAHNKDWTELVADQQQQQLHLQPNNSSEPNSRQRHSILADGNLLLIKSPQQTDNRAKFRCLANNTYGMHHADTELRLELYPQSKLLEIEPKIHYITSGSQAIGDSQRHDQSPGRPSQLAAAKISFNCTIRASNLPLVAIEWLKDGKLLASISLPQFSQLTSGGNSLVRSSSSSSSPFAGASLPKMPIAFQPSANESSSSSSQIVSMLEDENQELTLMEQFAALDAAGQPDEGSHHFGAHLDQFGHYRDGLEDLVLIKPTSLAKLAEQDEPNSAQEPTSSQHTPMSRLSQRVRFGSPKDHTYLVYELRFRQVRRSDRGSYECRARNTRGAWHATGQLLLRDSPPIFIETFPNQLINTESIQAPQASLKCIASGSPLPEISWRLSGFQIPESSRYRVGDYVTRDGLIVSFVNITNIQAEDGGLYECSAVNDVGQLRHSGWLNVTGGPYVRPMPNMSAIAGGSVSIMCPVGGWPIDQISWFQNSSKLPVNHRQKLFPNGTLLISDLDEVTDSGQYSCQAKWSANADLVATNSLHVSIKVPPIVEPLSFAKSLHRGQRYNIMCTVVRGDLPVNIRWFKDGRQLSVAPYGRQQELPPDQQVALDQQQQQQDSQPESRNNIVIKQLDPYSSTLTFASLQPNHRGLYTCEATNEAGRANQSSQLVIHVPPSWRIEPKDLSVTVDKTAIIDCQADAFPAARIEWRLSQDLYREPPQEFKPIISSLYMRVFENGSLIIYNTQRTDAGYYLCQASNGVGPGLSRVLKLTVHVAAHFKSKIRTELVRRGQPAKLRCESIGDPPLEINWLKDKMPLYVGEGGQTRYQLTRIPLQDGLVSELQISQSERSDSALFTCISQNQFGNDDTNIQLIVQSAPDPPLDIRIHEYEARSVKISWLPGHSGNLPISKYIVQYAQISAPPGGGPTNENTLMLLAADSSPMKQQLQSTGRVSQPVSQQQAPIQYSNVSASGNETSLVLANLSPLTEYQFFMYAVNAIGTARAPTNNEPIKFRTDDEAPSGPPQFVKAQALSSRSIKVRWRPPERRGLHYGSIGGYYVGYKLLKPQTSTTEVAASADTSASSSASDTFVYKTVELPLSSPDTFMNRSMGSKQQQEHECQLTGLRRAQKYLINIQAFNGRGAGPASESIVAETWRIDVPDPPIMRMLLRTTRSVHLAWRLANPLSSAPAGETQLVSQANQQQQQRNRSAGSGPAEVDSEREAELAQADEPILGFVLARRQLSTPSTALANADRQQAADEGHQSSAVVEMRLPGDHLSQIVDNLTCGTRYQFTIVALNSVGPSEPSEPLTVKTEGSAPVAPDKSSLLVMNSSSVLINLAAWHNGLCAMKSFEVMFKPSRSKKWTPINVLELQHQQQANQLSDQNQDGKQNPNQLVQRSAALASQAQQPAQVQSASLLSSNSTIVLEDLSTALNYDLRILATNEAGSTEALYTFNTNNNAALSRSQLDLGSQGGDFQLADASLSSLFSPSNPAVPWLVFLLFLALTLTTGCILFARRRQLTSSACSLSLSSASRSNQSTSNYYTSSGATTSSAQHNNIQQPQHHHQQHQQQQHQQQQQMIKMNGTNTLQKLHLINEHPHDDDAQVELSRNHILLGEVYGHHQLVDKSNYAYLSQKQQQQPANQQRPPSPQNTEMGSLLNGGSEAEMCLGASALNIANHHQPMMDNNQQQQHLAGGKPAQQVPATYYVTPMQLMLSNKQAALSQMANKSSTLPSNCHQQHHQQQQQQQQLLQSSASNQQQQQQQLVDNLMAANLIQQQQQQLANEGAYISMEDHNHNQIGSAAADMAALLEQQLQQQVYATVKRGCPRPPRLCDYGIYQCPVANQADHQMQCCADLAMPTGSADQQQAQICYHMEPGCSVGGQQQQSSDYQQLRPMGN